MQLTKTHKILIGLITVTVLASGIIWFTRSGKDLSAKEYNNATTTSTNIPGTNLNLENSGGKYTITQIPVEEIKAPAIPDLSRPIVFSESANLNDEAKKILKDRIGSLQVSLKSEPRNINNWVLLGTNYKIIGDYAGAVLYWKYAGDVSNDSVSLGNLGNLYAYYLKDNAMAEVYYKKAIARAPSQAYLYVQLSSVYKEVFNDLVKAKDILDEGLKKIPNDPALLEAKKNL
jgi:tetratricopeptide (TPR) repeat protein